MSLAALRRKVGPSNTTTQLGSQEWLSRLGLGRGRGGKGMPSHPPSDSWLTQYKQLFLLETILHCRWNTYCIITVGERKSITAIFSTLLAFTTQPCTGHQNPGWHRTAPGLPEVSSPLAAVWPPLPLHPPSESLYLKSESNMNSALQ